MKQLLCFVSILMSCIITYGQEKQKYFLFAYTQKAKNLVCGTKELVKAEEIELAASNFRIQEKQIRDAFNKNYNAKNGYENSHIEIVKPGEVILYFEIQKVYNKGSGHDCTGTSYGQIVKNDFKQAEKEFELLQERAQAKKSPVYTFKLVGVWPDNTTPQN